MDNAGIKTEKNEMWLEKRPILVTCGRGIAPYLRAELEGLGFPVRAERLSGVETEGTLADTLRLNLQVRTGLRVMWQVAAFRAFSPDALYAVVTALPWETFLDPQGYVCINSFVHTDCIRDTRFAGLKCKDAIMDRMRQACGQRPDSGNRQDQAVVFLYWNNEDAAVYLDTSGEPLCRRGYRQIPGKAPMQETLAAAVVQATRWQSSGGAFVNPMCGSGTLAIEAALMAEGRAPGLLREHFGFMALRGFSPDMWRAAREQALQSRGPRIEGPIIATDHDPKALEGARHNAQMAGVAERIQFAVCDFAATDLPAAGGVIMLNPAYGDRMGDAVELEPVYKQIGDFFKQRGQGYIGYVFTGNLDLAKRVGLRTRRRIIFFNSEIECRLLEFELYTGTRRTFGGPADPDQAKGA